MTEDAAREHRCRPEVRPSLVHSEAVVQQRLAEAVPAFVQRRPEVVFVFAAGRILIAALITVCVAEIVPILSVLQVAVTTCE